MDIGITLPEELQHLILLNINDTKTYFNCRLVCKKWNDILKYGKIYENYILKNIIVFEPNQILFYDNNKDKLLSKVIFYTYGYYKYIDYDNNNSIHSRHYHNISIESKPLKLIKKKNTSFYYETIIYNSFDDKKKISQITAPYPCNLM